MKGGMFKMNLVMVGSGGNAVFWGAYKNELVNIVTSHEDQVSSN